MAYVPRSVPGMTLFTLRHVGTALSSKINYTGYCTIATAAYVMMLYQVHAKDNNIAVYLRLYIQIG